MDVMENPSIFEFIEQRLSEAGFEPIDNQNFIATSAPPGSKEKLEVLRMRLASGLPLWHEHDRTDFAGLGTIYRPVFRGSSKGDQSLPDPDYADDDDEQFKIHQFAKQRA